MRVCDGKTPAIAVATASCTQRRPLSHAMPLVARRPHTQGVSEYGWKSDWENRWALIRSHSRNQSGQPTVRGGPKGVSTKGVSMKRPNFPYFRAFSTVVSKGNFQKSPWSWMPLLWRTFWSFPNSIRGRPLGVSEYGWKSDWENRCALIRSHSWNQSGEPTVLRDSLTHKSPPPKDSSWEGNPPLNQKRSGDPNPQYFSKSTAVQMGGVLPYKWEAYCSTNGRRIAGFPFLRSLEARKVRRYKWGAYCRTNGRCTAVLFRQVVGVGVPKNCPLKTTHTNKNSLHKQFAQIISACFLSL